MQPPISIGTLLQNHYRVVQLLGQGGFGRTYLAEDQGRFNERCAIKEFVPIQGEDHFSDKATQLFKREASVLYQISHPQIPQFRATFEEDERLFLVQDYVDGPTFHEVLNQRRQQDRLFSEGEVKLFLKQILPVLAHIHAKGIIHRDISPDNIILRQQDKLPVLIDFGVVKEVVTRMQLEGMASPATTVGKAGYAPSEQMQTGRAYPSSDLYALAVTAIVLMSGKEPQAMFDDVNFAWRWQDSVTVSPGLASILNKALAYKPGDRFQSVSEMAKAIAAGGVMPASEIGDRTRHTPTPPVPPPARPAAAVPPPSQMRTVAVGRAYPEPNSTAGQGGTRLNNPTTVGQKVSQNPGQNTSRSTGQDNRQNAGRSAGQRGGTRMSMPAESSDQSSLLENPLAVGGLALGLALVAGLGGWAVVQSLNPSTTPTPTITSLPPLGSDSSPTPTQVSPKPVEYQQPQLTLEPGVMKVVEGSMRGGDKVNYPLVVEAGQRLTVAVEQESMRLSVLGLDGEPVSRDANRVEQWEGELAESGEYRIQLRPARGVSSSDYRLEVTLSAPPAPEPVEPLPVEPEPVEPLPVEPEPVEPLPVEPEPTQPIPAPEPTKAPQNPGGTPNNPGGTPGNPGSTPSNPGSTPSNPGETPLSPQPAEPAAEPDVQARRVSFPTGTDSIRVANNVAPGQIKRYRVNASEGQILTVRVLESQKRVSFDLLMPGGEMIADAANLQTWQGFLPVGGDYSVDVKSNQSSEFTLEISASAPVPSQ